MICVNCGSRNATEGSAKHPYCKKCFKDVWNNNYDTYNTFLVEEHNQTLPRGNYSTMVKLILVIASLLIVAIILNMAGV